jgi:hypothetical protein
MSRLDQLMSEMPRGRYTDRNGIDREAPIPGEATECRDCGKEMVMDGWGVPTCADCFEQGEREGRYFRATGGTQPKESAQA